MSSEKDDEATVVVNIKDLKKSLTEDSVSTDIELEFNVDSTKEIPINKNKLILFDYKSNTFEMLKKKDLVPADSIICKDLKSLQNHLKDDTVVYILFNYHIESKSINKLLNQINSIYKNVKTIITAKGLTEEFIEKHKNSGAQANHYLNFPFSKDKLLKLLS